MSWVSYSVGRFSSVHAWPDLPVHRGYAAIDEDLRNQYSIGYTPDRTGTAGFRAIRLTTRQRGLTVQTRSGYYAT
jgi:hypothetical protein